MTHSYRLLGTQAVVSMEGSTGGVSTNPNAACVPSPLECALSPACIHRHAYPFRLGRSGTPLPPDSLRGWIAAASLASAWERWLEPRTAQGRSSSRPTYT